MVFSKFDQLLAQIWKGECQTDCANVSGSSLASLKKLKPSLESFANVYKSGSFMYASIGKFLNVPYMYISYVGHLMYKAHIFMFIYSALDKITNLALNSQFHEP
jgi:hypothetical protein